MSNKKEKKLENLNSTFANEKADINRLKNINTKSRTTHDRNIADRTNAFNRNVYGDQVNRINTDLALNKSTFDLTQSSLDNMNRRRYEDEYLDAISEAKTGIKRLPNETLEEYKKRILNAKLAD